MPHECTNCGRTFPDGSKEMLSGCPDCGGNKFQFTPARSTTASTDSATSSTDATDSTADHPDDDSTRFDDNSDRLDDGTDSRSSGGDADPTDESSWEANTADQAERSQNTETVSEWVSKRNEETDHPTVDTSDFAAWPDTARRPEDRTGSDDSTPTGTDPHKEPTDDQTVDSSEKTADTEPSSNETTPPSDTSIGEDTAQADARRGVVPQDSLPTESVENPSVRDPDSSETVSSSDTEGDHPPDHGHVVSEPTGETPSIEELRAELNEQFESIKIVQPGQYELNLMELYNREEYIISLKEDGRYVIDVPDSWRNDED